MAKTNRSPAYYSLTEGRKYGRITNNDRVIAAAYVLQGVSINLVAEWYNVSTMSVRNWVKTLYDNNPNLT